MRPGDKGSDNTGFQIWVFGPQVHAADLPKCWATESLTHQPHLGLRVSMWVQKGHCNGLRGAVCPCSQQQTQEVSLPDRNVFCISECEGSPWLPLYPCLF